MGENWVTLGPTHSSRTISGNRAGGIGARGHISASRDSRGAKFRLNSKANAENNVLNDSVISELSILLGQL
jgi:hypothetical protein